jgi:hypothetical protein
MNTQFQKLAEQAGMYVDLNGKPWPKWMGAEECEVAYKKFAELIVNECCNRLSEETIRHDGYGYNQHELYNRLRKHFGVEE